MQVPDDAAPDAEPIDTSEPCVEEIGVQWVDTVTALRSALGTLKIKVNVLCEENLNHQIVNTERSQFTEYLTAAMIGENVMKVLVDAEGEPRGVQTVTIEVTRADQMAAPNN